MLKNVSNPCTIKLLIDMPIKNIGKCVNCYSFILYERINLMYVIFMPKNSRGT